MTTKRIFLAGIAVLFFSCSDDDNNSDATQNEPVFDYFTTDRTWTTEGRTRRNFSKTTLQDQKFFSVTEENFINGQSQGEFSEQRYFYENGLLVKQVVSTDVREFFYDTQGRMIAVNWAYGQSPSVIRYYRFTHLPQQKVYFEELTLPYDNPAAEVYRRISLELDANDNIVKAGYSNPDEDTIRVPINFTYDTDGNLIKIERNGTEKIISYVPIKDNMNKIYINTFGKRNFMIYSAQGFANSMGHDLRISPNLRTTDLQESVFEAGPGSYYFKKTEDLLATDQPSINVTTFYFK